MLMSKWYLLSFFKNISQALRTALRCCNRFSVHKPLKHQRSSVTLGETQGTHPWADEGGITSPLLFALLCGRFNSFLNWFLFLGWKNTKLRQYIKEEENFYRLLVLLYSRQWLQSKISQPVSSFYVLLKCFSEIYSKKNRSWENVFVFFFC